MFNQIHTAADIAADRQRTLLAEAEAYRLAKAAAPLRAVRSAPVGPWLRRVLGAVIGRPVGPASRPC
jgi:predicted DCC family thiol-disulfide oxidoreductase YuxK